MEYLLSKESASLFESIKHIDEDGVEFWFGRELAPHLGYTQWRSFEAVIEKAKDACKSATGDVLSNFADVRKIVKTGVAEKDVQDFKLTRYACYLIAQNGDPRKREIAEAQTYFAIQTRYAEIQQMEEYQRLSGEEDKRLFLRDQLLLHNSLLADAAKQAGVVAPLDYAVFQNFGYKGLYGGLGAKEIGQIKGLKAGDKILDHMGSTELAANLFRATQTEEKLKRDNIRGKRKANMTHYEVGRKVRQTIRELGGTMPENLPPAENIAEVRKRKKLSGPSSGSAAIDSDKKKPED